MSYVDAPRLDYIPSLPTTPEKARESVQAFEELIIPNLSLDVVQKILDSKSLRLAIVGTSPEASVLNSYLGGISSEELKKVKTAINKAGEYFVMVPHYPRKKNSGRAISLLNLKASQVVVNANTDYFPEESRDDLLSWLISNPNEWRAYARKEDVSMHIFYIRHGLLSGIPFGAAKWFDDYCGACARFLEFATKEENIILEHHHEDQRISPQELLQLEQLLESPTLQLSKLEKDLLLDARSITGEYNCGYFGFNGEKDREYVNKLREIYKESGIETLRTRIQREYSMVYPSDAAAG